MSRRRTDPLRPLTAEERTVLQQIARARNEPVSHVARAKAVLAVAAGQTYQAAPRVAGRQSKDTVSDWVSRFNGEDLAALEPRHGGGAKMVYGATQRQRILPEAGRQRLYDLDHAARSRLDVAAEPYLGRDGQGQTPAQEQHRRGERSRGDS